MQTNWWQNAVFYQVYPRSFQDSNGDGIGDIQGIIQRLDYLADLGVNAIWLSPVYQSPNVDNGYDISNYQAINPEYGSMVDMEQLIEAAKIRKIKIVMDLVVNHTSDQHPWFLEARKSKDNPYRDFYIWRDPATDGSVPNDLQSNFKGSAWAFDAVTGQYYLHFYAKEQPDLNWQNPKVREAVYQMMTWWLQKGIGGFRMDVIDLIGKEPDRKIKENGPQLHAYLQEMNARVLSQYDVVTVGETWGATPEIGQMYSNPNRHELSMIFQFEQINLDKQSGMTRWDLKPLIPAELHAVFSKWQLALDGVGWNSLFWSNHDLPRIVSRWGDDSQYREKSAQALAIYLHMLKGTPYIYQGEEIGMTNYPITSYHEIEDIESRRVYQQRQQQGYAISDILNGINAKGRDNARHPMQWNGKNQSGFTDGTPWLPVNPNYLEINVELAKQDELSIYATYQQLIKLRKRNAIIRQGRFENVPTGNQNVISYKRMLGEQSWLVIINLSKNRESYTLPIQYFGPNQKIISNNLLLNKIATSGVLQPYDALVVGIWYDDK